MEEPEKEAVYQAQESGGARRLKMQSHSKKRVDLHI